MSILLLHGFTGHPDDLMPLEQAFTAAGFACHRPFLPGHGTSVDDLNQVKASDWLDSIEAYDADILVGLSMGALLSVIVASKRPVSKLILLSPAFMLRLVGSLAVWAAMCELGKVIKSLPKRAGSDILDPIARRQSKAYREIPLKALCEFESIRKQAVQILPKIKCPIYSFFGAQDHTVDVQKASRLVHNPTIFKRSAHILPLDYDHEELATQCLQILEK